MTMAVKDHLRLYDEDGERLEISKQLAPDLGDGYMPVCIPILDEGILSTSQYTTVFIQIRPYDSSTLERMEV